MTATTHATTGLQPPQRQTPQQVRALLAETFRDVAVAIDACPTHYFEFASEADTNGQTIDLLRESVVHLVREMAEATERLCLGLLYSNPQSPKTTHMAAGDAARVSRSRYAAGAHILASPDTATIIQFVINATAREIKS